MSRPTIVFKVGTSSLIDETTRLPKVSALSRLAEVTSALMSAGLHVIIVSSGAVGLGCARIGLRERPRSIAGKQAAAAVGQVRLMSLYDHLFDVVGRRVAQVLLTYETFGDRTQYLNARNTFGELLALGVVPIVNENDTVAVQELRVGDNDTLSALVAAMVSAEWLFLFTDVDSLYDADPRGCASAAPISVVPAHAIADLRRQMLAGAPRLVVQREPLPMLAQAVHARDGGGSGGGGSGGGAPPLLPRADAPQGQPGSQFGTGGMATKLKAAQLASAAGVACVVTHTNRVEEVAAALLAARAAALAAAGGAAVAAAAADGGAAPFDDAPPALRAADAGAGRGEDAAGAPSIAAATAARSSRNAPLSAALSSNPASPARRRGAGGGGDDESERGGASATAASGASGAPPPPLLPARDALLFAARGYGSSFLPSLTPVTGRKRWILALAPAGAITIDATAVAAIVDVHKALFPAGISALSGDFEAQDAVSILDGAGIEVARALVNHAAADLRAVMGRSNREIRGALDSAAVADEDNIVLIIERSSGSVGSALDALAGAALSP